VSLPAARSGGESVVSAAEQLAFNMPVAGMTPIDLAWANVLLARWGHGLGPVKRPFRSEAWALQVDSRDVAVAVSCSTVSEHIAWTETRAEGVGDDREIVVEKKTLPRDQLVELARLCADPAERWASRPMLRLWREVAAPRWKCWPVSAAVSYSQNKRHDGSLYRWDGWTCIADDCGSSGGGAWSRKRYATDEVHGKKSLWLWRYDGATP
jgi:hypothetical protein